MQKFRHQIQNGAVKFLFAREGVEALATLKATGGIDLVVTDINMPKMDGLSLLRNSGERGKGIDNHSFRLWRHGEYPYRNEPRRIRLFDQPIDFADLEATIAKTIRHVEVLREARERQAEAERAYTRLRRFLPPQVADLIVSSGAEKQLASHRREITALFCDLRGFTAF